MKKSLSRIKTSQLNTYFQEVTFEFIFQEILSISEQIKTLSEINDSPFKLFTPSPFEEETIDMSKLHNVRKQSLIVLASGTLIKQTKEHQKKWGGTTEHEILEKLNISFTYNLMQLYKNIGEFNQYVDDLDYINRTKIADAQSSFLEHKKFTDEYDYALNLTFDIFMQFYTTQTNYFYKPNALISAIEIYCIKNRIPFPKSKQSKAFIDFKENVINIVPNEARKKGRAKKGYELVSQELLEPYITKIMSQL